MLNFELNRECYINGVSCYTYGNTWYEPITIPADFDITNFYINFDIDVMKWVEDENANCIVDCVNVHAEIMDGTLVNVGVNVYKHDFDYGDLDPDYQKDIACSRDLHVTKLSKLFCDVVKIAGNIAVFDVRENITDDYTMEGF